MSTVEYPQLSDFARFSALSLEECGRMFADLRAHRPVAFFPEPEVPFLERGPGYYAVTRYDDVVAVSRKPRVFRSGQGATRIPDMPEEFREFFGSMINMDDPRHARLRRIVSRGFTPRRLAALHADIERTATEIVDDVIARGGECEVVTDIAAKLPLTIICNLMGIPASEHRFVFDRSNILLGAQDPEYVPPGTDLLAAVLGAATELIGLVKELGAARAADPTDDLISALVNAEIDGERLTLDELGPFFILLVVAGNETTRNAISWGVHLLSEHPDQRAAWAADVEGLTRTAVEEIVRWASPVIFMRRTLAVPARVGDVELDEGAKVVLFYWSANRDEAHFTDPEAFDLRRDPNPHVGFGGPGPHFCLGAHLARAEIGVMFAELLRRIPDLRTTAEPRRLQSMFINGVKHLPAVFTPAGPS
ncbi:MAG: cytochrome P450 [Pseudonocardiaceae bacterium]